MGITGEVGERASGTARGLVGESRLVLCGQKGDRSCTEDGGGAWAPLESLSLVVHRLQVPFRPHSSSVVRSREGLVTDVWPV